MINQDFVKKLRVNDKDYCYYDIHELSRQNIGDISRLPYSIRILVENLLRKLDGRIVREEDIRAICNWQPRYDSPVELPYHPARVLMQDFTGVPAVVDLAAMRDAVTIWAVIPHLNPTGSGGVGGGPFGSGGRLRHPASLTKNVAKEYERNGERYALLKWAQKSFANFKVVPPNSGICHQVNLEHLGRVVITERGRRRAAGLSRTRWWAPIPTRP